MSETAHNPNHLVIFFAEDLLKNSGMSVMQKSTIYNNPAYNARCAIDGNLSTFTSTVECKADPWWQIDFGQCVHVQNISIVNRKDEFRIGKY